MILATGIAGWLCAAALALAVMRLRARLELVARAEHELRGPLTAFGLALHAARGSAAGRRLAVVLEAELARARAGLADLSAARQGRRAAPVVERVAVDSVLRSSGAAWDGVARRRGSRVRVLPSAGPAFVRGDSGRVAQALGNVMSNAVEHGAGDVSVSALRTGDRLLVEVTNDLGAGESARGRTDRGRGLAIAAEAAADCGGTVISSVGPRRARAVIDLPLEP